MNKSSVESQNKASEPTRSGFVIGIGSPHGDDRAGWEVINRLEVVGSTSFVLRKAAVPHDLLDWLEVDAPTHIIDASYDQVAGWHRFTIALDDSGELQFFDVGSNGAIDGESALQSLRSNSTHQIDLLSTLQLVAALHRLPRQLTLWTVSITSAEKNGEVGAKTQEHIDECVSAIATELSCIRGDN